MENIDKVATRRPISEDLLVKSTAELFGWRTVSAEEGTTITTAL